MSLTTEQLLKATLSLPEEERLEFLEALTASLEEPGRPPLDESWRAVIQRRSVELRSGKVNTVPWSVVKQQARENTIG